MNDVKEIWKNFNKELKGYLIKKTQDPSLSDDILQEVFLKVMKNIKGVSEVENVQEYLYKVTRNALVDNFRAKKFHSVELQDHFLEKEDVIDENLNQIISSCCVTPFINKLPEIYRDAITQVELNDMPQTELADRLGISYSTAKSRVQRGREKLKSMLNKCCAFKTDSYGNIIESNSNNCDCK